MDRWFAYETGMPWCESAFKYETVEWIAEFANTVTNLPIVMLPLLNAFLIRDYIREVNFAVLMPHLLLAANGIFSALYHATLSLFGQLIDELSLLWLVNVSVIAFLPIMNWYPQSLRHRITEVRWAIAGATAAVSVLGFIKPSLNAFALMTFSIPGVIVIYHEGVKTGIPEAERFTWRVFSLWASALFFWFSDRIFCDFWVYLGAPYLHAAFHLLSSLAGYNVFVMFSLLDITRRSKEHNFDAQIRYFPRLSLPYIAIRPRQKQLHS